MRKNFLSAVTRVAAAAVLLCFAACASKNPGAVSKSNSGKVYVVAADKTSFYRYGPQQGNGPDQELAKDTLLTLIRPSFGYAKVQLVAGSQEGFVASEDIRPAPPTLLAALTAPPPVASSSSSLPENFDTQSSEPPPPEALPDPDLPPASAEPSPL